VVGSAREMNVGNLSPLQHFLDEVSVAEVADVSTNKGGCDFVEDARLFHWGLSGCLLTQAFYLGRVLRTLPPISFRMIARRACRSKPLGVRFTESFPFPHKLVSYSHSSSFGFLRK